MSIWNMKFSKVEIGEEFADVEDGDIFVKTSPAEAECVRNIGGGHCAGDVVGFAKDADVELKN